ncbi:MotA/TolQ/ExbB proton channel family protein [uncultured Marinobacter sp.]|uniref:MotA/TolQ/ExbB proton channel family protein n=1 Tax=uncultured Marinobacter sp. TaxID=187379 RepID=UPI0026097A91|nr:MotA/TolQ/ExbB proton channel family protein [uncultured Marinobacter sp.]
MSEVPLANSPEPLATPLSQLIEMGGPVMVVLLALAVAGAVTFVYLMLFGTFYTPRLTGKLKNAITFWQENLSNQAPQRLRNQATFWSRLNPLHHLLADTMENQLAGRSPQQVRETAARDAQRSLEPFEAPLKIIEVIAALAPLLGLLGTVLGMMEAFSAMAATEGRANASQLSGGIYEALTTTAAGLVVAIPFAALAAWIEFRLRRIHKTVNGALVSVLAVDPNSQQDTIYSAVEETPEPVARKPAHPPREVATESRSHLAHATG